MTIIRQLKNSNPNGEHYLINFFGCDKKQINSVDFWKKVLPASIDNSKMAVLKSFFYEFNLQGITGFLLLSSSHLSIHTWPEYQYVACDLFSCSDKDDTKKAIDYLKKKIKYSRAEIKKIKRGYICC